MRIRRGGALLTSLIWVVLAGIPGLALAQDTPGSFGGGQVRDRRGAGLLSQAGGLSGADRRHDHQRHAGRDDLLHHQRLQPVAQEEPGLPRSSPTHRQDHGQGVRLQEGPQGEPRHLRHLHRQRAAATAAAAEETGGTLFLASLTPQGGAGSGGSGSATLTLTQDQKDAVLRFTFSGLTGPHHQRAHPRPGRHDPLRHRHHAAAGRRLAGLAHRAGRNLRHGGRSSPRCTAGSATSTSTPRRFPAGEIKGFFRPTNGSQTFTPPPAPPALPPGPPTAQDAARFLLQATYGPRPGEVEALQQKGFTQLADEQFAMPALLPSRDLRPVGGQLPAGDGPHDRAGAGVLSSARPSRGPTSFASASPSRSPSSSSSPTATPTCASSRRAWRRISICSAQNAFGNFRDLLEARDAQPHDGDLPRHGGEQQDDPATGRQARTRTTPARSCSSSRSASTSSIPTARCSLDASNQPIPTYDQDEVEASRAPSPAGRSAARISTIPALLPPGPQLPHPDGALGVVSRHRREDGCSTAPCLPAGQSAQTDLEQSLDMHLPSPQRRPVLLPAPDPAAGDQQSQPGVRLPLRPGVRQQRRGRAGRPQGGAARHPARLRGAGGRSSPRGRTTATCASRRAPPGGLLRTLDARPRNGRWRFCVHSTASGLGTGQTPLRAPTVFNFFEPGLRAAGRDRAGRPRLAGVPDRHRDDGRRRRQLLSLAVSARAADRPPMLNLAPFQPPQAASDAALLDRVNLLLFAGAHVRRRRAPSCAPRSPTPTSPVSRQPRVLTLLWLASLTPESVVQK